MHKLKRIVMGILSSSLVLYFVGGAIFTLAVDQKKVDTKVLNYLRRSVLHVLQYSEGSAEYEELKFIDAIEYYQRILKTMPFQKLTHGALGYCYYTFGEKKKAIDSFKEAIKENPKFFGYYYDLGLIYYKAGNWKKAVDMLQKAMAIRIDSLIGYYSVISTRMFPVDAVSSSWLRQKSLLSKEMYEDTLKMIVLSYDEMKDYDSVLSVAVSSFKMVNDKDGFFHFYAGKAAYSLGKHEIAFQLFDQCIRVDPNNAEAFEFKGLILEKMGNHQAAQLFRERAKKMEKRKYIINKEPVYFVPLYELGG